MRGAVFPKMDGRRKIFTHGITGVLFFQCVFSNYYI